MHNSVITVIDKLFSTFFYLIGFNTEINENYFCQTFTNPDFGQFYKNTLVALLFDVSNFNPFSKL